jgi:cystathionine beta-lyase
LQWIDFGAYVKSGAITSSPQQHFLKQAKVALNCGKTFGEGFENYVRLNFGAPRSLIAEALERMRASM